MLAGAAVLDVSSLALPLATVAAVALGLWSIRASGARGDPAWVVIDEVAGQWVALLPLRHPHWPALLLAFGAFRVFDITKPGPVGWADRRAGAIGVMADDLIAGGLAAVAVWLAGRAGWLDL